MTTEARVHASEAGSSRARSRHPAARGRALAAGISAGATLVLVGTMNAGSAPHTNPPDPAVVVVRQALSDRTVPGPNARAPVVTSTKAPALTESSAS